MPSRARSVELRDIPWRTVRRLHRDLRRKWFTVPEPTTAALTTPADIERVEQVFGTQSYAPNWEFSYNYHDEDLNLSRVVLMPDAPHDIDWWQTHLRGWEQADGSSRLRAHWEPEPTEHPREHLKETGFSWERGTQNVRSVARDADLSFTHYESLAPPGGA